MLTLADILQKKDADLVSLTERIDTTSAAGKMIFRLLSVLAEFERDLASDRTREALRFKKANGEKCGGSLPPFGYVTRAGRLYRDEKEQAAVALILGLHGKGESLRDICRDLEVAGYRRKGGSASWHPMAVQRIIEREKSLIEHKPESRHLSVDA
jgi:DNA invertase Pin-like site-specific DNA recombinase